ncbi:hypothetical protein L3Q82_020877, partial [Scortum barcoo]
PWPVEGTLNPDVVKTMKVLVSTYKADQKKGKKGEERKEKRQMELGILQRLKDRASVWSDAGRHGEEEEILEEEEEETTLQTFSNLQRCVITVDSLDILPESATGQESATGLKFPSEETSEEDSEEASEANQGCLKDRDTERSTVQPGDKVFIKVFRRKWYNERREEPFEVVRSTGTAVQVKGSPTWYHLSHRVKSPKEEIVPSQSEDVEGSREPEEDHQAVDNVDGCVSVFDDAGGTDADNGQGGKFSEIDFQYVPETEDFVSGQSEAPKVSKDCDSTA